MICVFFRLASRLANPFGHPSQVRTQVLVLQTCVDLRRLASPFGQGFYLKIIMPKIPFSLEQRFLDNHECFQIHHIQDIRIRKAFTLQGGIQMRRYPNTTFPL